MSAHRGFARCSAITLTMAGLSACYANTSLPTPWSSGAGRSVSPSAVVTTQEFASIVRQGTLMEALERLRPSMLLARGGRLPLVSVDGAPPTDLSVLRTISASHVREVRLQRASSSAGYSRILPNGDVIVGDMIVVTTLGSVRRER
jgi:hypothetical protein